MCHEFEEVHFKWRLCVCHELEGGQYKWRGCVKQIGGDWIEVDEIGGGSIQVEGVHGIN